MKNILIRTDSSSTIGLGHVMRDLVLAQQFPKDNITFATQSFKGNINNKILEANHKLTTLKSKDKKELVKLIKNLKIDLLIIDHYDISYKIEKYIKEKTDVKIFVLDDTYKKHHCDTLLNHNMGAKEERYKNLVPKKCELRCGVKHTLLRDEFYQEKEKRKALKQKRKQRIFLAIGGVDNTNINLKILKIISKFKNIKVELATSASNNNLKELKNYSKDKRWITLHINSDNIAKLMRKSDFGIITPSVTANEAYFMNLPFLAIKTAKNQKNVYKYLKRKNYPVLRKFNSLKFQELLENVLSKIDFINYTNLNEKEKNMILSWRNHPRIKKWMYNKKDISIKQHLLFITSLQDSDKIYFLLKRQNDYLGTVNLTNIQNKEATLGLFSNPNLYGIGKALLKSICHYSFHTLRLERLIVEVFLENTRAFRLYKEFNFREFTKKTIDNKEVICMELKNEHR